MSVCRSSFVLFLLLAACGGSGSPAAPAKSAASSAVTASSSAPDAAGKREFGPKTLPNGDGPVPASTWEAGRPSWLEGELLPHHVSMQDGVSSKDPEISRERDVIENTRTMATADRFAWGKHTCTAPRYEQRVITRDARLAEQNRPSATNKSNDLFWEVRVACAPGKGDVELAVYRVIRDGGILDASIVGTTPKFRVELKPKREIKEEVELPAPEPGGKLASGEGPLPPRAWEAGRPAWFDGEFATDLVLFNNDEHPQSSKARVREREVLLREHMVVAGTRISYAGHVCSEPAFEQRLVPKREWLAERRVGGSIIKGEEVWAVRIRCAKGKGDFAAELGRSIVRGKMNEGFGGTLQGFDVYFASKK